MVVAVAGTEVLCVFGLAQGLSPVGVQPTPEQKAAEARHGLAGVELYGIVALLCPQHKYLVTSLVPGCQQLLAGHDPILCVGQCFKNHRGNLRQCISSVA